MEKVYQWLTEVWLAVDGKLSFIKPLWLRIAVVATTALLALHVLNSLLPLVFGLAIVAVGVIFLFKMLHEAETSDDDPEG